MPARYVLAVGADNAGADLKNQLAAALADDPRVEVRDFGVPDAADTTAYPHVGIAVAEAVASGAAKRGLLVCGTGIGMAISANKVGGIRAALCGDAETARGARVWNDANCLALSLRTTSAAELAEILDAWLDAEPSSADDDRANVEHLGEIERG